MQPFARLSLKDSRPLCSSVSDLLRGRIDLFSTDALIDLLARLGAEVRLKIKVRPAA